MDWEGEPGAAVSAAIEVALLDNDCEDLSLHKWMPRAGSFRKATQKQKERQRKQEDSSKRRSRDSRPPARKSVAGEKRREERRGEEKSREEKNPLSTSQTKPTAIDRKATILEIYDHYRRYHPQAHRTPKASSKESRKIRERLEEGYTVEDLCRAIDGCHRTPHNLGQNDRNQTYLGLELIMRTGDQVTRFIEAAERHAQGSQEEIKRGLSEKTRRTAEAGQRWLERTANDAD